MIETTYDMFKRGVYLLNGVETALPNDTKVLIKYGSGFSEIVTYYSPENTVTITDYPAISIQKFRDRFDINTLMKLDQLQDNIDDDNTVISLTNLTTTTLPAYRNYVRTAYKNLYSANNINIDSQQVIDGINLLTSIGVISSTEATKILDVTTL